MRFFHAGVYRARYRELIREMPDDGPLEPFAVTCPRCGDTYVADLAPEDEPWDLEEQEWEAVTRLERECPDHAHVFAVGP